MSENSESISTRDQRILFFLVPFVKVTSFMAGRLGLWAITAWFYGIGLLVGVRETAKSVGRQMVMAAQDGKEGRTTLYGPKIEQARLLKWAHAKDEELAYRRLAVVQAWVNAISSFWDSVCVVIFEGR